MRPKPSVLPLFLVALAVVLACALAACYAGPYYPHYPSYPPGQGPGGGPTWSPSPAPPASSAGGGVSFFYSDLSPYGDWVRVEPLGWVWVPWDMPAGWRPYTYGRWVYTGYGWTWVSDWGWGWGPFHYGRWSWNTRYGWVWAPGTVWAPAWVAWRSGPGWVGWAPLPPGVSWRVGIGLDLGAVNLNVAIGSTWWVFVDEHRFLEPRPWRHAYPAARNDWFVHRTRDVTRYADVDGHAAIRSLPVGDVERALGHAVPRYRVDDVERSTGARIEAIERDRLKVYRPDPERGAAGRTRPGTQGRQEEPGRANPPAATRSAPSPATVDREYQKDLKDLDRWKREQSDRLDAIHRQEAKEAAEKASAEELRRRQAAEARALAAQAESQRKALDARYEKRKDDAAKAQAAADKARAASEKAKAEAAKAKAAEKKEKAKRRKPPVG